MDFRDELRQEPWLAIGSMEDFRRRWGAEGPAFAFTTPKRFESLRRDGVEIKVVAADARRVIVKKPAGNSHRASQFW